MELNYRGNYIIALKEFVFENLAGIKKLDLSFNELEFISEKCFGEETKSKKLRIKVETLSVSLNKLTSLGFIRSMENLKELNASFNLIQSLSAKDFGRLLNLEILDLSQNNILLIDSFSFYSYFKLKELVIFNINTKCIFSLDFDMMPKSLIRMDISHNCFFNIKASNVSFEYLHLKMVNTSLINNSVLRLHSNLLGKIINFDFSNVIIRNFSAAVQIRYLTLTNQNITTLDELVFPKHLNSLNLSFNQITSVKSIHFNEIHLLSDIDLSFNQIEYIEENCFLDKNKLTQLYLNNNQLKSIDFLNILDHKLSISINFQNNLIEFMDKKIFTLLEISKFDLSFNRITNKYLEKLLDIFKFNELKYLKLNGNLLSHIGDFYFKKFAGLLEVYLNQNRIKYIHENSFNKLTNLKRLDLQNNELDYLHYELFRGLYDLEYLNLSGNRLIYLESELFGDLFKLITLDISNNGLKKFKVIYSKDLRRLK